MGISATHCVYMWKDASGNDWIARVNKGDHVTVGPTGGVHWIFQYLDTDGMAVLESGMTGRRRRERPGNIRLYERGE